MAFPRRLPADALAALLLAAAAAVLLSTPYDGGACRNVAAAFAVPAASLETVDPPARPQALAYAEEAVNRAQADSDALADEQAAVDKARDAATKARAAADKAQSDSFDAEYSTDYVSVDSAQSEVDYAQMVVDNAESWLKTVQDGAADTSEWGSIYTQQDVDTAQADLDDDRAKLATAQAALDDATRQQAANDSAVASAEQNAKTLAAAADTAEAAAAAADKRFTAHQSEVEEALSSAQSTVSTLENDYHVAVAAWAHDRRVRSDEVVALNNVRASCRENGGWRAGVAVIDMALLAGLGLRRWWPQLVALRIRRPRWSFRRRGPRP